MSRSTSFSGVDNIPLTNKSVLPRGRASVADSLVATTTVEQSWRSQNRWTLKYQTAVVEEEYCTYAHHSRQTVLFFTIFGVFTCVGGLILILAFLQQFHAMIAYLIVSTVIWVLCSLFIYRLRREEETLFASWTEVQAEVASLFGSQRVALRANAAKHEYWCVLTLVGSVIFVLGLFDTRIECDRLPEPARSHNCLNALHGTALLLFNLNMFSILIPIRLLVYACTSIIGLVLILASRFVPFLVAARTGTEAYHVFLLTSFLGLFCVILPAAYLRERSSRLDFEIVVERFMRMEESKRLRERLQATTQGDVPPRLAHGVHDRDGLFGWCPEGIVCGVAFDNQNGWASVLGSRDIIWLTHAVCRLLDDMRLTLKTSCYRYRAEGDHFLMATGESGSLGEIVAFVTKAVASILVHPELRRVLPPDRTRTSLHGVVGAVARGPFAGLFLRSSRQYTLLGNPARAVTAALGKHVPLDVAALVTVLDNAPELERDLVIPSDATPDTLPDFYAADELRSLPLAGSGSTRRARLVLEGMGGAANPLAPVPLISSTSLTRNTHRVVRVVSNAASTLTMSIASTIGDISLDVDGASSSSDSRQLRSLGGTTRRESTRSSPHGKVCPPPAGGLEAVACTDDTDHPTLASVTNETTMVQPCALLSPFTWKFVSPDIEAQYAAHSVAAFDLPRVVLLWIAAAALTASAISAVAIEYGGQRPNGVILASIGPVVIAGFALVLESRTRWLFVALDLLHTVLFSVGITVAIPYGGGVAGIDLTLWFVLLFAKHCCRPLWAGPTRTALPMVLVMIYFGLVCVLHSEFPNGIIYWTTVLVAFGSAPWMMHLYHLMDRRCRDHFTILLQVDAMKAALDADYERLKEALAQLAPHGVAAQMTQRARNQLATGHSEQTNFTTTTFGSAFLVIEKRLSPHEGLLTDFRRAAAGIQAVHAKVGQLVREVEEGTLAVQATSMRVVVVATRSGTESEEEMALRVLEFAMRARQTLSDVEGLQMLVHSGYVTGAVIGLTSLTFQYFGPAFVVADQILQNAPVGPGALMVTARTVKMLAAEWGQPTTEVGCTVGHCVPFSVGDGSDASHECALVCQGMWRVRGSAGLGMYMLKPTENQVSVLQSTGGDPSVFSVSSSSN